MTKTLAPAWANDESLYDFPINAIHLGENFTAPDDSRPVLSNLYVKIAKGVMTAAAADGFSAAILRTKIAKNPLDRDGESPDVEFFLHREQLIVLRKMPFGKHMAGDPVIAVNASGQVRVGSPRLGLWANESRVTGPFPNIETMIPKETGKIEALTMGVPVMHRFMRFASKVRGEWLEFRQDAKGASGAVVVKMRSHMSEVEDYDILLMPVVRSK